MNAFVFFILCFKDIDLANNSLLEAYFQNNSLLKAYFQNNSSLKACHPLKKTRSCKNNLTWVSIENSNVKCTNLDCNNTNFNLKKCQKKCLEDPKCFSIDFNPRSCCRNKFSVYYNKPNNPKESLYIQACCNGKNLYLFLFRFVLKLYKL